MPDLHPVRRPSAVVEIYNNTRSRSSQSIAREDNSGMIKAEPYMEIRTYIHPYMALDIFVWMELALYFTHKDMMKELEKSLLLGATRLYLKSPTIYIMSESL